MAHNSGLLLVNAKQVPAQNSHNFPLRAWLAMPVPTQPFRKCPKMLDGCLQPSTCFTYKDADAIYQLSSVLL
jgi:hypothetical protein